MPGHLKPDQADIKWEKTRSQYFIEYRRYKFKYRLIVTAKICRLEETLTVDDLHFEETVIGLLPNFHYIILLVYQFLNMVLGMKEFYWVVPNKRQLHKVLSVVN